MEHPLIPTNSVVVVCDGAKALILRNDGDATQLSLSVVDAATAPEPATRDLGTERPGRVYQSVGMARSAVEETDFHSLAETVFLIKLGQRVDALVNDGAAKHIVLVAPPKSLGILRASLAPATRAAIAAEIPKDLAHLSIVEIERHLAPGDR
ncbi:MAG: host attachment family protein [Acidiphilium sp.]|nr:host attachment family protein [Acidiphilium sp.]MDD4934469.1 host attachment family protein [Acidiphilium sp.]